VEDFPVRPDDDELLVEEFEMLELQPALMRALRSHTRHLATRDHPNRTGRQDRPPAPRLQPPPLPGDGSSASSTAAKAATTSPARCAPRLPQRSFSARDDLRHAPVDPHLGVM
jgi:hypothetical protein